MIYIYLTESHYLYSYFLLLIIITIIDADEWAAAWSIKMESFGQNNTDLIKLKSENSPDLNLNCEDEEDNLPLCAYCGFEEKFLGNQFVKVCYVMLCYVMLCYVMLFYFILYCVVLCYAMS